MTSSANEDRFARELERRKLEVTFAFLHKCEAFDKPTF
jgi:hypothetical protein